MTGVECGMTKLRHCEQLLANAWQSANFVGNVKRLPRRTSSACNDGKKMSYRACYGISSNLIGRLRNKSAMTKNKLPRIRKRMLAKTRKIIKN